MYACLYSGYTFIYIFWVRDSNVRINVCYVYSICKGMAMSQSVIILLYVLKNELFIPIRTRFIMSVGRVGWLMSWVVVETSLYMALFPDTVGWIINDIPYLELPLSITYLCVAEHFGLCCPANHVVIRTNHDFIHWWLLWIKIALGKL